MVTTTRGQMKAGAGPGTQGPATVADTSAQAEKNKGKGGAPPRVKVKNGGSEVDEKDDFSVDLTQPKGENSPVARRALRGRRSSRRALLRGERACRRLALAPRGGRACRGLTSGHGPDAPLYASRRLHLHHPNFNAVQAALSPDLTPLSLTPPISHITAAPQPPPPTTLRRLSPQPKQLLPSQPHPNCSPPPSNTKSIQSRTTPTKLPMLSFARGFRLPSSRY